MDPQAFPDPEEVKLDRPLNSYLAFGDGPHQCFGREIGLSYLVGVVKYVTSLKNVRPAAGGMGVLKTIKQGGSVYYLSEDWSSFTPYASSKLTSTYPPLFLSFLYFFCSGRSWWLTILCSVATSIRRSR